MFWTFIIAFSGAVIFLIGQYFRVCSLQKQIKYSWKDVQTKMSDLMKRLDFLHSEIAILENRLAEIKEEQNQNIATINDIKKRTEKTTKSKVNK